MSEPTSHVGWIVDRLKELGFDQRSLALALGWDPSSISRAIGGGRSLRPEEFDSIIALLGTLGVPPPADWSATTDWSDEQLFFAMALRRELRRRSLRSADATKLSGVSTVVITNLMKLRGRFDEAAARQLAAGLERDFQSMQAPPVLMRGAEKSSPARPQEAGRRGRAIAWPEIPIYAPPLVNSGGIMRWDPRIAEHRPAPPPLAQVEGAFGFFAPAGWLEPRYVGGEVLFVHPTRPAAPGCHVLIHYTDNTISVSRLTGVRRGELEIGGDDVHPPTPIKLTHVQRMHRIIGSWAE